MKNIHIAVMDYSDSSIKMYNIERRDNYDTEDIESWLVSNTNYSTSSCYYMYSENEIPIIRSYVMRIYFDFHGDFHDYEFEDICFGAIEFDYNNKHYIIDAVGEINFDFNKELLTGRFKGEYEHLMDEELSNEEIETAILNMDTSTFRYNVLDDGETLPYTKLDIEIVLGDKSIKFILNKE